MEQSPHQQLRLAADAARISLAHLEQEYQRLTRRISDMTESMQLLQGVIDAWERMYPERDPFAKRLVRVEQELRASAMRDRLREIQTAAGLALPQQDYAMPRPPGSHSAGKAASPWGAPLSGMPHPPGGPGKSPGKGNGKAGRAERNTPAAPTPNARDRAAPQAGSGYAGAGLAGVGPAGIGQAGARPAGTGQAGPSHAPQSEVVQRLQAVLAAGPMSVAEAQAAMFAYFGIHYTGGVIGIALRYGAEAGHYTHDPASGRYALAQI